MTPSISHYGIVLMSLITQGCGKILFTHTKEGSYGPGESIQFYGQFSTADLDLVRYSNSMYVFNTKGRSSDLSNRAQLDCTIELIDTFENGQARPLTQDKYLDHFWNCDSVTELEHGASYGLIFGYSKNGRPREHVYSHVKFMLKSTSKLSSYKASLERFRNVGELFNPMYQIIEFAIEPRCKNYDTWNDRMDRLKKLTRDVKTAARNKL